MSTLSTLQPNAWLEVRQFGNGENISLMDRLYNRLDGMYPHKWRANFANTQAIENWRIAWAEAFAEERITPQEVSEAIKACRRMYDWPPSLPEFLKACRQPVDLEAMFCRAVREMRKRRDREPQDWQTPQLFWAAASLGNDLFALPYRELAGRWREAWERAAARKDEPVPDVADGYALPAPGKTHLTREQAEVRMAEVKAAIGGLAKRMVSSDEGSSRDG